MKTPSLFLALLALSSNHQNTAFAPRVNFASQPRFSSLCSFNNDGDRADRLQKLGIDAQEIERSNKGGDIEEPKVRVDLVDNIDATVRRFCGSRNARENTPSEVYHIRTHNSHFAKTITAIGFGLIAFNFLVLANMGDGGLGGVVATIINKLNE